MRQKQLPNGKKIYCIDEFTAEYVYNEIFINKCYFQNGISVKNNDTIFDIGANIGLFSIFVSNLANNLIIYTFEPILENYECLMKNTENLSHNVIHHNIGLSDQVRETEIYFNPNSCGQSSLKLLDKDITINNILENWKKIMPEFAPILKYLPKFMRPFLARQYYKRIYFNNLEKRPCKLTRLSDFIQENNIECINLLKLDAENYEMEVLLGLEDEDWSKIDQITMEVHPSYENYKENTQKVKDMLTNNGFSWTMSELDVVGCYNVYAVREK